MMQQTSKILSRIGGGTCRGQVCGIVVMEEEEIGVGGGGSFADAVSVVSLEINSC